MKWMQKWWKLLLVLAVLAGLLGGGIWATSRPVVLDPAQLTAAETGQSHPDCRLSLEVSRGRVQRAEFHNESGETFYHGDPPDYSGLEVCLGGVWYHVPHRDYATAGVGKETGPGETFSFAPILSPYGRLPDGQYRLSFGYWLWDEKEDVYLSQRPFFVSYAGFAIQKGQWVLPTA